MERYGKRKNGDGDRPSLDSLREGLEIDKLDLDEVLISQPELYYHAADRHVECTSKRDSLKLDLSELEAEIDKLVREKAAEDGEKITEATVRSRVITSPKVSKLNRDLLAAQEDVARWAALKDAYVQRQKILGDLVSWTISTRNHESIERQSGATRSRYVEAESERNKLAISKLRRERDKRTRGED